MTKVPAVILSLSATGLAVARSLGYHDVEVYGLDFDKWQIGHFSRYVNQSSTLAYRDNKELLLRHLINYAKGKNTSPVLFVTGDDELQIVSEYAEVLRRYFKMFQSCNMEFTGLLLDKRGFYKRCMELGAEIPRTFFPKDAGDLVSIAEKISYPAIIKPGFRHKWRKEFRGKKVIQVSSPTELLTKFGHWRRYADQMVVQEVIPGKEENISVFGGYFDRNFEPVSVFTAKKIRQCPPMFGSGSFCESYWIPEIAEMSINLVRKMRYHGICGTEYKWDPRDGKWKLIEINFRPTLWFGLTRASGIDIVYDAYLDLTGQEVERKIGSQKNGVFWQYLVRDSASMAYYLRKSEMNSARLKEFFTPRKEYAVICSKDWRINLVYPFYIFWDFLRYL